MCGPQQKECVEKIPLKHEECLAPCQGLIVGDISAEFLGQNETDTRLGDLLEEYERFKRQFQDVVSFPEKLKSTLYLYNQPIISLIVFNVEFQPAKTKKHFVRIYIDTPTFERITKDSRTKFQDILSTIGGTLGLLTGFSLIR